MELPQDKLELVLKCLTLCNFASYSLSQNIIATPLPSYIALHRMSMETVNSLCFIKKSYASHECYNKGINIYNMLYILVKHFIVAYGALILDKF